MLGKLSNLFNTLLLYAYEIKMFVQFVKKFLAFFALSNLGYNKLLLPGLENDWNSGNFKYKNRREDYNL